MSQSSRPSGGDDDHEPPTMPWDHGTPLLKFVRSHAAKNGAGMGDGGYSLPDEERVGRGSKLRWAVGRGTA